MYETIVSYINNTLFSPTAIAFDFHPWMAWSAIVFIVLTAYLCKKLDMAREKTRTDKHNAIVTSLKEDNAALLTDLSAALLEVDTMVKQVDLLNRNHRVVSDELAYLKTKLAHDTEYKNNVYRAIVNFYQITHSMIWRGSLSKIVTELLTAQSLSGTSVETQRCVDNLYELKNRYVALDSELRTILVGVPAYLDALTSSLVTSDEMVEVAVVVPVGDATALHQYTMNLRKVYEGTKPAPLLEEA
jgi:hypothetical protein